MDDIVVAVNTQKEHDILLRQVLDIAREELKTEQIQVSVCCE